MRPDSDLEEIENPSTPQDQHPPPAQPPLQSDLPSSSQRVGTAVPSTSPMMQFDALSRFFRQAQMSNGSGNGTENITNSQLFALHQLQQRNNPNFPTTEQLRQSNIIQNIIQSNINRQVRQRERF